MGCMFKNGGTYTRGWNFQPSDVKRSFIKHLRRPSFRGGGPNTGLNWTEADSKFLENNLSPPVTIVTNNIRGVIYMGGQGVKK